jgi:hypothetical protein
MQLGASGEVGKGLPSGDDATGELGTRMGNINWRKGGAAGARQTGADADTRTRNVPMTTDMAIKAASKGENWIRFFLHPGYLAIIINILTT